MRRMGLTALVATALTASVALAATSTRSVPSSFGGNGHNASFDGRLYIVRTAPGWQAYVLRPEATTYELVMIRHDADTAKGVPYARAIEVKAGANYANTDLKTLTPR